MTQKNRLTKLEKNRPPSHANSMTDEARMEAMKQTAQAIAAEATAQGITAQDDPRLALPLALAELLDGKHEQK